MEEAETGREEANLHKGAFVGFISVLLDHASPLPHSILILRECNRYPPQTEHTELGHRVDTALL